MLVAAQMGNNKEQELKKGAIFRKLVTFTATAALTVCAFSASAQSNKWAVFMHHGKLLTLEGQMDGGAFIACISIEGDMQMAGPNNPAAWLTHREAFESCIKSGIDKVDDALAGAVGYLADMKMPRSKDALLQYYAAWLKATELRIPERSETRASERLRVTNLRMAKAEEKGMQRAYMVSIEAKQ